MNKNYFQGNNEHPYHISVGAVVCNDKKEVLCHYFDKDSSVGYYKNNNLEDFYILMRATVKPSETLEETLHRGLQEEFGVKGEIITYVGSIQGHFEHKDITVEKTTLYFLVKSIEFDESKRGNVEEASSKLQWQTIDRLIPKMKEQTGRFDRTDFDESVILERVRSLV